MMVYVTTSGLLLLLLFCIYCLITFFPSWQVLLTISELSDKINDGSYTIRGGVLDPNAFYICLLALLMEVSNWLVFTLYV